MKEKNRIFDNINKYLTSWSLILLLMIPGFASAEDITLLNVSYDPTRELFVDVNAAFAATQLVKGHKVSINQSHGGSGKQARAVIDGLEADVVTLALGHDIDEIVNKSGNISSDWQKRLPDNSAPYTSAIVFLVRKGNPKAIKDWGDLIKPGIEVITPNPKTSGGARWNYLAAWSYALQLHANDEIKAKEFMTKLFQNVPVLDSGARGSTTTFVERGIGDVLIAWENEAYLAVNQLGKDQFEIVMPSLSILAEPSVSIVDKNVDRRKTREVAEAYLNYLYTPEGQEIIAKHYFRPRNATVATKYAAKFPQLKLVTIADLGGWKLVQQKHFSNDGIFDEISLLK